MRACTLRKIPSPDVLISGAEPSFCGGLGAADTITTRNIAEIASSLLSRQIPISSVSIDVRAGTPSYNASCSSEINGIGK